MPDTVLVAGIAGAENKDKNISGFLEICIPGVTDGRWENEKQWTT